MTYPGIESVLGYSPREPRRTRPHTAPDPLRRTR